jgi:hypothetical protein
VLSRALQSLITSSVELEYFRGRTAEFSADRLLFFCVLSSHLCFECRGQLCGHRRVEKGFEAPRCAAPAVALETTPVEQVWIERTEQYINVSSLE